MEKLAPLAHPHVPSDLLVLIVYLVIPLVQLEEEEHIVMQVHHLVPAVLPGHIVILEHLHEQIVQVAPTVEQVLPHAQHVQEELIVQLEHQHDPLVQEAHLVHPVQLLEPLALLELSSAGGASS